jgi:hypothetical protein
MWRFCFHTFHCYKTKKCSGHSFSILMNGFLLSGAVSWLAILFIFLPRLCSLLLFTQLFLPYNYGRICVVQQNTCLRRQPQCCTKRLSVRGRCQITRSSRLNSFNNCISIRQSMYSWGIGKFPETFHNLALTIGICAVVGLIFDTVALLKLLYHDQVDCRGFTV